MCLRMSNRDRSHSQIYLGFFFLQNTLETFGANMERPCHAIESGNQQTSKILSILLVQTLHSISGQKYLPQGKLQTFDIVSCHLSSFSPALFSCFLLFVFFATFSVEDTALEGKQCSLFSPLVKHGVRIAVLLEAQHLPHLQSLAWCQQLNISKSNISICFPRMTQEKIQIFLMLWE